MNETIWTMLKRLIPIIFGEVHEIHVPLIDHEQLLNEDNDHVQMVIMFQVFMNGDRFIADGDMRHDCLMKHLVI